MPTTRIDSFATDNLPPPGQWPHLLLDRLAYPDKLNASTDLLDRWIASGTGTRPCMASPSETWTYTELAERVNRIANVLTRRCGLIRGNRVLLRAPNTPLLVAAYLAVMKAGGIAVPTMPLLRTKELTFITNKARIGLALCDHRLIDDLQPTPGLRHIVPMGGEGRDDLLTLMKAESPEFHPADTRADEICLIAFTSGTTGVPKGTMHTHRDLLAVCDTYGRHVLRAQADDVFTGSPPIAFTFGLGGLVLFPLRVGASALLLEKPTPDALLELIRSGRITVCFTAPTAYRAMLDMLRPGDTARLRICVSAGEALPKVTWERWKAATGIPILDGIGSTEMLHIFIGAPAEAVRPGATGIPVPGYEAKLIDEDGNDLPRGSVGRLAVRGPTGCRYLADQRQTSYVRSGWNITGDTYLQDRDGYFWFQARSDDMIVSSGYNISGPEVEAALITHPAVAECAVVGAPDEARGTIVTAFVVLQAGVAASEVTAKVLQDHVKQEIAPYKYPRRIEFLDALPRTESGKVQRYRLRAQAGGQSVMTDGAIAEANRGRA